MSFRKFQRATFLIAQKDLKIEFRRPHEILSILTFSAGSVLIASLALRGSNTAMPEIVAAVLWIIIFFINILTFTTSFTREADRGTLGGLKTLPCSPLAILAGKIIYGTALIFLAICVLVPCSILFLNLRLGGNFLLLFFICFLGAVGFSFAGSFVSGLVMFSEGKTLLLSLLLIPVCMPVILLSVISTGKIIRGAGLFNIIPELRLFFAFLLLITAIMISTFTFVLEE
jgi:heme exporter protein B